jgi:hypothetical protein
LQKSQSEWRYVFFVCAGFDLFGALVFGLFASGMIQDWARDEEEREDETASQLNKDFTLLVTMNEKEDHSQNEEKSNDREESTEIKVLI